MQPDAATRPQDHGDFGSKLGLNIISVYRGGAADAPNGRPRENAISIL